MTTQLQALQQAKEALIKGYKDGIYTSKQFAEALDAIAALTVSDASSACTLQGWSFAKDKGGISIHSPSAFFWAERSVDNSAEEMLFELASHFVEGKVAPSTSPVSVSDYAAYLNAAGKAGELAHAPEKWDAIQAHLARTTSAQPISSDAQPVAQLQTLLEEAKRVAHNTIHDAIEPINLCELVKASVREALDEIDLAEFASPDVRPSAPVVDEFTLLTLDAVAKHLRKVELPTSADCVDKVRALLASRPAVPVQQEPVAAQPQDDDSDWRRLALQFDGHRMQAIWHLKAMLSDPQAHAAEASKFLAAGPLSGEEVLAQRIAAIAVQPSQAKPQEAGQARDWMPMETAPKDGTMLRLLVQFDENATEDSAEPCPTIGANSFVHSGEDVWQFAGWNWEQDCFDEGVGTPVGWLPLLDVQAAPSVPDVAVIANIRKYAEELNAEAVADGFAGSETACKLFDLLDTAPAAPSVSAGGPPQGMPDLSYDMLSPDEMRRHVRTRQQERCQHDYKSSPKLGGAICGKCGKIEPPPIFSQEHSDAMYRAGMIQAGKMPQPSAPSVSADPQDAKLPPLPEPFTEWKVNGITIFSADQMREYAHAAIASLPSVGAGVVPELTDDEIVKVLASLGIDANKSKYGFPELQVGTNVPGIRKIVSAYIAAAPAAPLVSDLFDAMLDVLDEYPEQLVLINRKSAPVTRLRAAIAAQSKEGQQPAQADKDKPCQ
jgi:hypothetical protein